MEKQTVIDALSAVGARLLRQVDLGGGLSLAQWRNNPGSRITYSDPGHHTISLYLDGSVRRLDGSLGVGSTGALCLLPAEGESFWQVVQATEFVHLYVSRARYQRFAAEVFDRDARSLTLPDRSFMADPFVAEVINRAILPQDWGQRASRLMMAQAGDLILTDLMRKHGPVRNAAAPAVTGGLAPHVLRRVQDLIDSDPAADLSIDRLAQAAGLSPYHFARMFRLSTGQTPHRHVMERRLLAARTALADGRQSMTEIAADCGFSSPAHFAAQFKARFGVSPSTLRAVTPAM